MVAMDAGGCPCCPVKSREVCKSYHCVSSLGFEGALWETMPETVELKVAMTCEGCVGAVKRVLGKMPGVESYDVDLKEQKVTVKGDVKPDDVLQTVSKTGKATSFWPKA